MPSASGAGSGEQDAALAAVDMDRQQALLGRGAGEHLGGRVDGESGAGGARGAAARARCFMAADTKLAIAERNG